MRKLSISDIRWEIYIANPDSNSYKGFSTKGTLKENEHHAKITFSNGDKEFNITAPSLEQAYIKGFDKIDDYQDNKTK